MNAENDKEQQQDNKTEQDKVDIAGILGKKVGMTRIFDEKGKTIPVTVIKAGPCEVTDIRTIEKDGYNAVQLGFEGIPEKKLKKPQRIYFQKNNLSPQRIIAEIRQSLDDIGNIKKGDEVRLGIFKEIQKVDVAGISKGKGFQGGVKRWGWSIGPRTHGSRNYRRPGSIGASADPSRVVKGKHMPGRMGNRKTTMKNLEIVKIDEEKNIMAVKGSIPGSRGAYLMIKKAVM